MPQHQTEPMTGTIDGVNTSFFTTVPYTAGSVAVWVNGQLQMHHLGNPWTETNPATGEVTLGFAPEEGDTIVASFYDTSPLQPETEVRDLAGTLDAIDEMVAELSVDADLAGTLDSVESLEGGITQAVELDGIIEVIDLVGEIHVCD